MKTIKELLCDSMHSFVKEHIDEVETHKNFLGRPQTYEELGFKNRTDMLRQIKNDTDIAHWALTELLAWGLNKNYCRELFVEEETDTFTVFKLLDGRKKRYFICNYDLHKPIEIKEVKPITKIIEVNTWEDIV